MTFTKIGILGSGIMGSGIAEVSAAAGATVILRSRLQETADKMLAGLEKSLAKQVEKGKRTQEDADQIRARVSATTNLTDLADCDLIIESVVENLDVKKQIFKELDEIINKDAVLATNTSTLSVLELAAQTNRGELVCGVHFFNPANTMSLVEIVRASCSSDETINRVTEFAKACGKDPVEVKDVAGFIVNALLFPYLNNAIHLLEDGVATREGIDIAMKGGCGFPMGPFALLDLVGLDTSLSILEALYADSGEENFKPRPMLRELVAAGKLGRKTGSGFFDYGR